MKLNNFLAYLVEAVDINELRQKVGDEVPAEVLDKLAAKMKGRKYDNIAMAIIKKIQEINTSKKAYMKEAAPYIKFLEQYPNVVYSALKKAAAGNPDFDPRKLIDDSVSLGGLMSNTTPKKYWYDVYTSKPAKAKKEEFGLKNAKVRELKDEYLIFPKTFKANGPLGIPVDNLEKQWEDIRALSAEIARKDTSGEERDGMKATDNHWCVASSDSSYYDDYKEHGGTFVIIVKKNPDGSPDWNKRYLYYGRWYDLGGDYEDTADEFADKFDDHLNPERVLSKEANDILLNLSKKPSKIEKQHLSARNRIHKAYEDWNENSSRTNTKEWQAFRTLINTINKWSYEQNKSIKSRGDYFTYGDLRKTITDVLTENNIRNGKDLLKYMDQWGSGSGTYHREVGNYIFQLVRYYNGNASFDIIANTPKLRDRVSVFSFTGSPDEVVDELKAEARKTDKQREMIKEITYNSLHSKVSLKDSKLSFHPKTDYSPEKYLRGNKEITRAFEALKAEGEHEVTWLPYDIKVKRKKGSDGEFVIKGKGENGWPAKTICDLTDPDMPKKIMNYLNNYTTSDHSGDFDDF